MNKLTWIGTIAWGVFVTGFGLTGVGSGVSDVQPQDLMLLIVGGMVICLVGVIGLVGCLGWMPEVRPGEKSCF